VSLAGLPSPLHGPLLTNRSRACNCTPRTRGSLLPAPAALSPLRSGRRPSVGSSGSGRSAGESEPSPTRSTPSHIAVPARTNFRGQQLSPRPPAPAAAVTAGASPHPYALAFVPPSPNTPFVPSSIPAPKYTDHHTPRAYTRPAQSPADSPNAAPVEAVAVAVAPPVPQPPQPAAPPPRRRLKTPARIFGVVVAAAPSSEPKVSFEQPPPSAVAAVAAPAPTAPASSPPDVSAAGVSARTRLLKKRLSNKQPMVIATPLQLGSEATQPPSQYQPQLQPHPPRAVEERKSPAHGPAPVAPAQPSQQKPHPPSISAPMSPGQAARVQARTAGAVVLADSARLKASRRKTLRDAARRRAAAAAREQQQRESEERHPNAQAQETNAGAEEATGAATMTIMRPTNSEPLTLMMLPKRRRPLRVAAVVRVRRTTRLAQSSSSTATPFAQHALQVRPVRIAAHGNRQGRRQQSARR